MNKMVLIISLFFAVSFARAQCTFENYYLYYYPLQDYPTKTISTSDGGNITVGQAYHDSLNPGGNNGQDIDMIVIKTDQCGKTLWRTHYGYQGEGDAGIDVIEAENGDYMVLGAAYWQQSSANPRVVRFSKTGQVIWSKLYSGFLTTEPFAMIKRKNKNSYVICGYTDHMLTPHNLNGGYLLEINDSGVVLKSKEVLGIDSIFGILNIFEVNDTSYLMIANSVDSMYIFETDTSFNIRWIKNLFNNKFYYKGYYSSCISFDEKSIAVNIRAYTDTMNKRDKMILSKIDFQGNIIKYNSALWDTFPEPICIIPTPENGYLIGANVLYIDSNLNAIKYQQFNNSNFYSLALNKDMSITASGMYYADTLFYFYIVKIDTNGNYAHVGINETQLQNTELTIYPNPAINELHIETTSNEKLVVQLYDITGKQILENISFTHSTTINTSSLNQGLYFVRITDANGAVVKIEKVAVVK